jgi:hypothetical protein
LGTGGKCPPATFFWLKCRAGWRETVNVDQRRIGPDGTPLANEIIVIGGLPDSDPLDDAPPEKKFSPPVPPLV